MHSSENIRDMKNLEIILGHPLDSRERQEPLLLSQEEEGEITGCVSFDLLTREITYEDVKKPES